MTNRKPRGERTDRAHEALRAPAFDPGSELRQRPPRLDPATGEPKEEDERDHA